VVDILTVTVSSLELPMRPLCCFTAATYLARYRRFCCLIDDGLSRAALIPASHNYPGFKGIAGPDLLARLREQALLYGADLKAGRVTTLRRHSDGAFVARGPKGDIPTRTVLLATGLIDDSPQIEGLMPGFTPAR
jgi:thioredoxin reductase (NADPH)